MRFGVHLTNSGRYSQLGGDEDEMAGWNPELVNRAMELLENIAGVYRVSKSPLRHLGEGPVNTCAGFAWTGDGLTHAQFVKQMAEEGHTPSIALLMEVASALGNPDYPDRQDDAKLAQLLLAGVSKTKRAAATKDIAAWLEAEAAEQEGS